MSGPTKQDAKKLRIGFIHPDLGIGELFGERSTTAAYSNTGGAERLVVDAAVALQRRGHDITIFTSRHDPTRCFEETRNGTSSCSLPLIQLTSPRTLQIRVLGSSIPQRLPHIKATIILSLLRSILLSILLILSIYLPPPASPFNPLSRLTPFDVFVVDQQSVCVPLLRFLAGGRVVFYCHFPDKLLSAGWVVQGDGEVKRGKIGWGRWIYRWPIDKLEEITTGA
jgi:alpha-1,3/alpha-1,6-mannosyltransferase